MPSREGCRGGSWSEWMKQLDRLGIGVEIKGLALKALRVLAEGTGIARSRRSRGGEEMDTGEGGRGWWEKWER